MLTEIKIIGAKVHNLKNICLTLPKNALIVFTGLSGSGKSSLAFDTIYAEGQRRYMESLSSYARQFLDKMDKPDVDHIEGLSPAISIDQKSSSHNPRSTVATVTEIYDYFRLLFASIGVPYCPTCHTQIRGQSIQEMVDMVMGWPMGTQVLLLSPLMMEQKGEHKVLLESLKKSGFTRVKINGDLLRLDEDIQLEKHKKYTIDLIVDRLEINADNRARLFESIETCVRHSKGLLKVEADGRAQLFSEALSCTTCGFSLTELSHRLFSFNSPIGACSECKGLGDKLDFDPDLVIEFPENPIWTCTGKVLNLDHTSYGNALDKTARKYGFTASVPFYQLTEAQRNIVLYGKPYAENEDPFLSGVAAEYQGLRGADWEGVITNLRRRYYTTHSEMMRYFFRGFMSAKPCFKCQGNRLKPDALSVKIGGDTIATLTSKSVSDLIGFFATLSLTDKQREICHLILKEITSRLSFLNNVGLGYLTLNRKSGTLSGGEFQRIRLATQIGAGLTGVLYVLDEPSIGLHQRDNLRLIETLKALKDIGNTLIVVEHDEDTIKVADYIVDIGPEAGRKGGEIVFAGTLDEFRVSDGLTAQYISHRRQIKVPSKRRIPKPNQVITIENARENNLKNITVSFPLGVFIAVTGVSGSGKSTLINDILHLALMRHFFGSKERPGRHDRIMGLEHIDKLITIDQSPIGRTPRSNPATYTQVLSPIRDLYAETTEAKIRGFKAGRFSFNVKGGRCEACEGDGVVKIDMHFMSDVYVTCEICKGKRFNDQTLEVKFKGKSISDVLSMTVSEAMEHFANIPSVASKLKTLEEVGLGYVQLGQNATTLSGGEAQRIKLAKELSKRSTGKTLYLLDEPTTGLHFADIEKLLHVLNRLVDSGNTVLVIEHNLDVIKTADYIIDLGPEGGHEGGMVVAQGTPEQVSRVENSYTGQFLMLSSSP